MEIVCFEKRAALKYDITSLKNNSMTQKQNISISNATRILNEHPIPMLEAFGEIVCLILQP
jgi:hypothetical protein